LKKEQLHIHDDEYTRDLERGIAVLSSKINLLREQHRRIIMGMILANGGRMIIPKKILFDLNPKDSIAEFRDPTTGNYIYTVVIHPRKDA